MSKITLCSGNADTKFVKIVVKMTLDCVAGTVRELGSGPRYMNCVTHFSMLRESNNTLPCENRTRNSRMTVCCLTRTTCKNVLQNLIPLATAYRELLCWFLATSCSSAIPHRSPQTCACRLPLVQNSFLCLHSRNRPFLPSSSHLVPKMLARCAMRLLYSATILSKLSCGLSRRQ